MTALPDIVIDTELRCDVHPNHTIQSYYDLEIDPQAPPQEIKEIWQSKKIVGRGGFGSVRLEECLTGKRSGEVRAVKKIEYYSSTFTSSEISRELEAIGRFSQKTVSWESDSYLKFPP